MDADLMHTVEVLCFCEDIEHCRMERYIADVRIAEAENAELRRLLSHGTYSELLKTRSLKGALDGFVVG